MVLFMNACLCRVKRFFAVISICVSVVVFENLLHVGLGFREFVLAETHKFLRFFQ